MRDAIGNNEGAPKELVIATEDSEIKKHRGDGGVEEDDGNGDHPIWCHHCGMWMDALDQWYSHVNNKKHRLRTSIRSRRK